jgi:hypothetical protein
LAKNLLSLYNLSGLVGTKRPPYGETDAIIDRFPSERFFLAQSTAAYLHVLKKKAFRREAFGE